MNPERSPHAGTILGIAKKCQFVTKLSYNIRKDIPATLAPATDSLHPPRDPSPLFPLADPVDLIPPGLTNATHNPGLVHLKLREIQNLCSGATVQVGVEEHRGITDKGVDDLNEELVLLRTRLVGYITEVVTTLPPTTVKRKRCRLLVLLSQCVIKRGRASRFVDPVSAEASGTEVNGGATVTVPAEESAANDEPAAQMYRGDGLKEGEKYQRCGCPYRRFLPLRLSSRKQIVLLSWHVNPSTPVQMEEGHVNSGYGGPRSPAMDMGDAGSSLFSDVQPYSQL
ncbi:hypothetical protein BKA70DRAFT_1242975 [Coprinopsis sp. MPI-PUGE-AT-0042]|nr:hypothetical protein BKA70DRAFT_1242975 [Coprinopsis sp. MPI-PUGE-AT-0042]